MNLGNVCEIIMGQAPAGTAYNDTEQGVPLLAGAGDLGEMYPNPSRHTTEANKLSQPGDIILCIRATIGTKNWADKVYCLGRGVAALRPKDPEECFSKFLWHWLSANENTLREKGRGATFLQVSKSDIEELPCILPLPTEQHRIATILDKADAICRKRQEALKLADAFVKSVFLEMFGDPVLNPKGWEVKPLEKMGILNRGVSKHRPRNDPKLLGGPYPLVQTGEVTNTDLYMERYIQTYSEMGLKQSKMWEKGTLCITIAANIAKTALLGFDACFPDSVVGFNANETTNNFFVHYWFSFFQKILEEQAPESAQKNINLKILHELRVISPPLPLQNRFAEIVQQVEAHKQRLKAHLAEAEQMKKALQQQFFG